MSIQKEETTDFKKIRDLPIVGKAPASPKEEEFLREFCEYEFMNLEEPGLAHKFPYGSTRNSHTFTFIHGGKYKVPRFIARHIESCSTPLWEWRPNGLGGLNKKLIGNKPRFQMRQVFSE